ncbi:hypothetical protein HDU77_003429 [Chytriomyces hyalinus]|nr:hypothetical protein HDU77_003429 [Chytriomyces hyalinus]
MAAMILVGILRHCATQLINTMPKSPLKDIRQGRTLPRSRQLRFTTDIPEHAFGTRCQFLMDAFEKNEVGHKAFATISPLTLHEKSGCCHKHAEPNAGSRRYD